MAAVAILAVALSTRFGFLGASPDKAWPHSVCFEGDGPLWVRFASALQRGEPFEFNLPIHTPGMAYLLAWIWDGRVQDGFFAEKALLCVLGSLSCLLVWLLARGTFGERVAVITGLLSAASFGLAVQATSLNNEAPYTFLILIICLGALVVASQRSIAGLAVLAILNGVAVLFRAEHTLLFAMLCVYLLWRWRRAERTAPAVPGVAEAGVQAGRRRDSTRPSRPAASPAPRRGRGRPGAAISLGILMVGFLGIPLPWNIRNYRAIQRFNTVEPRPVQFEAARVPWTPPAVAFIRSLPAFAREGNFLLLTDLAAARGLKEVSLPFVERWFTQEAGYVPRPVSPFVFVSAQGPLSFALANNAFAEGGFSIALLDPQRPTRLAFGNPRHLQLFERGYAVGLEYLARHPADALRLLGRKLAIFGSGLTQGFTPLNLPLGTDGIRRPADQMGPLPGTGRAWSAVILLLGAAGLYVCARRRIGGIVVIVVAYKALVTVAFYGYVREAVSVLPFFLVPVVVGLDALLLVPLLKRWPRLAACGRPLAAAGVLLAAGLAIGSAMRPIRYYDVVGNVDPVPAWGPGAFESHQPLTIRQIR